MITKEEIMKGIQDTVSGVLEKLVPETVKSAVEAEMKARGLDQVDRKHLGLSKEDVAGMESKEKIAKFIKAVAIRDSVTVKALSEGTDSAGGYLVPEEFQAELLRVVEDFGLIRRFALVIPMKSDTRNIPRLSTSVTVYWPGEGAAGTESDAVFGRVQLLAKTAVGLTVVSNELLEDSDPAIADLLLELFAESLAGEEDKQGLVGSGSPFTGILNDAGVTVVTMAATKTAFTDIVADDLRDLIAQVKVTALSGAAFIMHRTVWATVQKIKENSQHIASFSNPVVSGDAQNGVIAGYIWGYPVYLSDKMPSTSAAATKFIAFGNLKYVLLGDRKEVTLKISDSATVGSNNTFAENESAVRVTERIAIAVGLPAGFSVLKTAAA